jgi:hypothetical protein
VKRDRVIEDKGREETADFVMDWLKNADEANTAHTARAQLDDEARQEREFMAQFQVALNERLQGSGLFCMRVRQNGEGSGYHIVCKDRAGRPYNASLLFDEWLDSTQRTGADAGREMVTLVARRVIEAREHYFRRMQ